MKDEKDLRGYLSAGGCAHSEKRQRNKKSKCFPSFDKDI